MKTTLTTIAGGRPGDAVTVRHLRADGTQHEIGRALAHAAASVHGSAAAPRPVKDVVVEEARRRWFATNYPVHSVRMRGIAEHFGLHPADPTASLDWLGTYDLPAGCSVAFYPGATTKHGHGILSRNFDFPTATFSQISGLEPVPNERALAADPWVVELHPEDGYASLAVGIMDVMGAMDGVNEAGLTVALLADNETPDPEPTGQPSVGLSEQQVVRYLLDTCATVAEAKQALLVAKHYYFFTPCHFVVADRSGAAFVWEHSPRRNREWIVQSNVRGDGRLVCTNHLLHQWPDPILLPADDGPIGTAAFTYRRWRTLSDVTAEGCVVGNDDIREHFRAVGFVAPIAEARTFWHALYDVDDASAELTFHVRDVDGVTTYSDPIQFGLGQR
jgi:predicted choloylglycine hydrolase